MKREEAKISAWENLQRAKPEAAIRKLEVFEKISSLSSYLQFCNLSSTIHPFSVHEVPVTFRYLSGRKQLR